MKISFERFVKKILNSSYEIPECMELFIKGMENNRECCICLHRRGGRRIFDTFYKEYITKCEKDDKND